MEALRSTLLLENPPPEDDNEAAGKEDDGDLPGPTAVLWKPPLAELERRLEDQDRRSIIIDPLRVPALQGSEVEISCNCTHELFFPY